MNGERWVRVEDINGGQLVVCALCGKKVVRRAFLAKDTNYAEALRLATAFASRHAKSEVHAAAIEEFHHGGPWVPTSEELMLSAVFGNAAPDEQTIRRRSARHAAQKAARQGKALA